MLYINQESIFPPVSITSPEQFVPLYLTYRSPHVNNYYTNYKYDVNISRDLYMEMVDHGATDQNLDYTRARRSSLKKDLMDELNFSYPDSYSLDVTPSSISRDSRYGDYSSEIVSTFKGENSMGLYLGSSYLGSQGFFAFISNTPVNRWISDRFKTQGRIGDYITSVKPVILVLVKAKHIPTLRAIQHLKLKNKELPLSDMLLLTKTNPSSVEQQMIKLIMKESYLDEFISKQGLIRKFVEYDEMNSYLMGPPGNLTVREFTAQLEYSSVN